MGNRQHFMTVLNHCTMPGKMFNASHYPAVMQTFNIGFDVTSDQLWVSSETAITQHSAFKLKKIGNRSQIAIYADIKQCSSESLSCNFSLFEIVFLTLALYHGLNGLYAIFQDYVHHSGWRLLLFSLACLAGLVLLAFGVVTVLSIQAPELAGAAGRPGP